MESITSSADSRKNSSALPYICKSLTTMNSVSDYLCRTVEDTILTTFRLHAQCSWDGGECWWPGVEYAWHKWCFHRRGKPVTEEALKACLRGLGIPESSFSKPGGHTYVELGHLSFVYRTRRHKNGSWTLAVSPHLKGARFSACGHAFASAVGDPGEMARFMLELDGSIPEAKAVAKEALMSAYRERTERAIRHQAAGVWLGDFFQGRLPVTLTGHEIADSRPGSMDLIRLIFHEPGAPDWDRRYFNIPYALRDLLKKDDVEAFISDLSLLAGNLEIFHDDKSGKDYPIVCFETDKNLFEEEEDDDEL